MENFKGKIGKKARVEILKARRKTYWYKNKKGKRFTAKLNHDKIFTTHKDKLVWAVCEKTKYGQRWIQINDAKIIKWM